MLHVHPATLDDYPWIWDRCQLKATPEFRALKAVDGWGRIVGMVGYDGWTQNAVHLHMAFDSWVALRRLVTPGFQIPFERFGLNVAIGVIPSHNIRSLKVTKGLGFRETHRIKDGWARGDDLVIHEMTKAECRWLGKEHRNGEVRTCAA